MAIKAYVSGILGGNIGDVGTQFSSAYIDTSTNLGLNNYGDILYYGTDLTTYSPLELMTAIQNKIIANGALNSWTLTANDIVFLASPFTSSQASSLAGGASPTFNSVTRSLNTAFQISATQKTFVSYGVDIAASLSLTGGATGTVTLQYADNSGMSTNLITVNTAVNGNTGTLTIGLALTQTATATLSGIIPAGKYVRIVTANTVGTPTFTYRTGQEVLS